MITITLAVPAYGRPSELHLLLQSVIRQTEAPEELLICEDRSPQGKEVRAVFESYRQRLEDKGIRAVYQDNSVNLGYDGNLRHVISQATSTHVMLLGNDDALLPDAIASARAYVDAHDVNAVSRAFARFTNDPQMPVGYSKFYAQDHIFTQNNSQSGVAFRLCAFFGGLIFKKSWADALATDKYDGTLYYQAYLFFHAFLQSGIGYIAKPIVGARVGNVPLFGAAQSESSEHTQGRYTAVSRGAMWRSILRIAQEVGDQYGVDILSSVRYELTTRMSFHLFEMFALKSRQEQKDLRLQLLELGLYDHWLPKCFYYLNRLFGKKATLVYALARRIVQ
jgi:glycosyltransferase involved in cell wall biosynthesis